MLDRRGGIILQRCYCAFLADASLANMSGWNLHQATNWNLNVFAPAILGSLGQGAIIGLATQRTF
jgi:hypothetical protein